MTPGNDSENPRFSSRCRFGAGRRTPPGATRASGRERIVRERLVQLDHPGFGEEGGRLPVLGPGKLPHSLLLHQVEERDMELVAMVPLRTFHYLLQTGQFGSRAVGPTPAIVGQGEKGQ